MCHGSVPFLAADHPRVRGVNVSFTCHGTLSLGSSPRARGQLRIGAENVNRVRIIPACAGSTKGSSIQGSTTEDHPRVRGVNWKPATPFTWPPGSSPRARGQPGVPCVGRQAQGIIPACAGSTGGSPRCTASARDHPRVRGVNVGSAAWHAEQTGSSPRARGQPPPPRPHGARSRIIPACAGSTITRRTRRSGGPDHPRVRGVNVASLTRTHQIPGIIPACAGSTGCPHRSIARAWDHPRVRGVNTCVHAIGDDDWGSSPRARGQHSSILTEHHEAGIIPACAGSTPSRPAPQRPPSDHPRVRGVNTCSPTRNCPTPGSSPRARGQLWPTHAQPRDVGIIPACAGSTETVAVPRRQVMDHPRVRGVNRAQKGKTMRGYGSSPRARGQRGRCRGSLACLRIIPACAGSTSTWRTWSAEMGDHPRVRGVNVDAMANRAMVRGSSPRARGQHADDGAGAQCTGIIPACAGSTAR